MLEKDLEPIQGDENGNDLKWDSLVLESDLYLKSGNYALLRDVRVRQARFTELEGKPRIAAAYYLMAFYADLNGFSNLDRLLEAKRRNFQDWKFNAQVEVGIVNKISHFCSQCGISDHELRLICKKSFVSGIYQCHLFTVDECIEILMLARTGNVGEINSRIAAAERRFVSQFGAA